MNRPELLESWSRTLADLVCARAFLPADLGLVDDWLEHNELGLALEALEALGDEHAVPDAFWAALLPAADRMGLTAAADRIRQRLPT
jgi:hypothetical protein